MRSEYFRTLWADTDRQILVVYHAEPGSPSAERLALLAAPRRDGDVHAPGADSSASR